MRAHRARRQTISSRKPGIDAICMAMEILYSETRILFSIWMERVRGVGPDRAAGAAAGRAVGRPDAGGAGGAATAGAAQPARGGQRAGHAGPAPRSGRGVPALQHAVADAFHAAAPAARAGHLAGGAAQQLRL